MPMWFVVAFWGDDQQRSSYGPRGVTPARGEGARRDAANRFVLFTAFGSAVLLLGPAARGGAVRHDGHRRPDRARGRCRRRSGARQHGAGDRGSADHRRAWRSRRRCSRCTPGCLRRTRSPRPAARCCSPACSSRWAPTAWSGSPYPIVPEGVAVPGAAARRPRRRRRSSGAGWPASWSATSSAWSPSPRWRTWASSLLGIASLTAHRAAGRAVRERGPRPRHGAAVPRRRRPQGPPPQRGPRRRSARTCATALPRLGWLLAFGVARRAGPARARRLLGRAAGDRRGVELDRLGPLGRAARRARRRRHRGRRGLSAAGAPPGLARSAADPPGGDARSVDGLPGVPPPVTMGDATVHEVAVTGPLVVAVARARRPALAAARTSRGRRSAPCSVPAAEALP